MQSPFLRVLPAGLGLVGLLVAYLLTAGPPATSPDPPGTFSFAALGDAPYYPWEDLRFRLVRQAIREADLELVLHVGDIFFRPCSDELMERSRRWFDAWPHPVIYTPGDNEWADCWERQLGGYAPRERLARLREIFFEDPTRSLGGRHLPVVSQGGEFVENLRWSHRGVIWATLHLVGSHNALDPFPGRTAEDDAEVRRRVDAAVTWVRAAFAEAEATSARAIVLACHADPPFDDPRRRDFHPWVVELADRVAAWGRPVLLVQGDDHDLLTDHPLVDAAGDTLRNFTRLQVPGSPDVGWVRVRVTTDPQVRFDFEASVIPEWKFW